MNNKSLLHPKFPGNSIDLEDLERLAGLSADNKPGPFPTQSGASKVDKLVETLQQSKTQPKTQNPEGDPEEDRLWRIQRRFADLADSGGRAFARFVGDILDILLSEPIQMRFLNELVEAQINRYYASREDDEKQHIVPAGKPASLGVRIGGEARVFLYNFPKNYLKRKFLLSSMFIKHEEFPSFKRLMKQIKEICTEEWPQPDFPKTIDGRRQALKDILQELRHEITASSLAKAWLLLEYDEFQEIEWVYNESRSMHLVRPTFYEDLDKAYREGKKLLKLLIKEFDEFFPPDQTKQDAIKDYLDAILEIYTHHHFVLKYFNSTRATISRVDFEELQSELNGRIEELREESEKLRENRRQLEVERDQAVADAWAAQQKATEAQERLRKCAPEEVERQIKSMEAKFNSVHKELQGRIEAEAVMQSNFRRLDEENEQLTAKLRNLDAIPDDDALSVKELLSGKRVVVFGGVGRDHYWPVLEEAGVAEHDYEWYEGYKTISLARTADIVGRCDLVVVVTSYAGHLLLYQSRDCITPKQKFAPIHSSGAGSLRKTIRELYQGQRPGQT